MANNLSNKDLEKVVGGLGDETRTTPGWYYTMTYFTAKGKQRTHEDGPFGSQAEAETDALGIKAQGKILGEYGHKIEYEQVKKY